VDGPACDAGGACRLRRRLDRLAPVAAHIGEGAEDAIDRRGRVAVRGEHQYLVPLAQPVDQRCRLALVASERDRRIEVADYEDPHSQKTSKRWTLGLLSRPIGPRSRLGNWVTYARIASSLAAACESSSVTMRGSPAGVSPQ